MGKSKMGRIFAVLVIGSLSMALMLGTTKKPPLLCSFAAQPGRHYYVEWREANSGGSLVTVYVNNRTFKFDRRGMRCVEPDSE